MRSRRHRILIVTDNLPDQINGVVTTYRSLEQEGRRHGYEVVYLHPDQLFHIGAPSYPAIRLAVPLGIGRRIEDADPDFVHIATEGVLGISAKLYCDYCGITYTTAFHTRWPEALHQQAGVPKQWGWAGMRWFHNHSGRVFVATNSLHQLLREQGINTRIERLTRGVDRSVFRPDQKKRTPSQNGGYTLLYVGRVSREKEIERFLDLFPNAPKVRKQVVGGGPHLSALREKYPNVHFAGEQSGKGLAEYYQKADVMVFPSCWDTFGIVMVESMACGTPVAGRRCAGPLDVIDEGITGYTDDDLSVAVERCLGLNRQKVFEASLRWSWVQSWKQFQGSLVRVRVHRRTTTRFWTLVLSLVILYLLCWRRPVVFVILSALVFLLKYF